MNISDFRETLATQLAGNSVLTNLGAKVHRYPPGKQATLVPTLFLNRIESISLEDHTYVGDSARIYQVTGGGYAPAKGASDGQWAEAEGNAQALLDELRKQIEADRTLQGVCADAQLTSASMEPSTDMDAERHYFDINFTITARVWG